MAFKKIEDDDCIEVMCQDEHCRDYGTSQEYTNDMPVKFCSMCGGRLIAVNEEDNDPTAVDTRTSS